MNHKVNTPENHEADLLIAMTNSLRQSFGVIAASIAAMPSEKRLAVSDLCAKYEIQGLAEVRILAVVSELMDFKRTREAVARTPKERKADLMAVAAASRSLFDAIARLSLRDSFNLHASAFEMAKNWPEGAPEIAMPTPSAAQLETVGVVAQVLAGRIGSEAAPGGSRPTREVHAAHIGQIWRAFCDSGRKPRRGGGGFEGLCDAVFELAGVPSQARGPIEVFKKKFLPVMQRGGAVVEAFEAAHDALLCELLEQQSREERRKNPEGKHNS